MGLTQIKSVSGAICKGFPTKGFPSATGIFRPLLSPTLSKFKKLSSPLQDIRCILQNVTLLQHELAQNDKQMFHVKYKLFWDIKHSSVPNCRRWSNCIFSKFSPPSDFITIMIPHHHHHHHHIVKIWKIPPLPLHPVDCVQGPRLRIYQ